MNEIRNHCIQGLIFVRGYSRSRVKVSVSWDVIAYHRIVDSVRHDILRVKV